MVVYVLLIIYLTLLSCCRIEKYIGKWGATIISILPLFVLTAFRGLDVGNDTYNYYHTYQTIRYVDNLSDVFSYSRMEWLFLTVAWISNKVGLSYFGFQILVAFITYTCLAFFIKKYSVNAALSCLIFVLMRFICGPMNVVRMYLAIGFLLLAFSYLEKDKLINFVLLVLLAGGFHKSAYLFMVMFPLSFLKNNWKNIAVMILTSIIVAFIGKDFFYAITEASGYYQGYVEGVYFENENRLAVVLTLLLDLIFFVVVTWNSDKIKSYFNDRLFDIIYFCIILVICIDIIGLTNTIMGRISGLFSILYVIILPCLMLELNKTLKGIIMNTLITFGLLLSFFVVMVYRPLWSGVVPYSFFGG